MSRFKMSNLLLAFITGLTSGGISCVTIQGGLLASAISEKSSKYKDTFYFLFSKLLGYTILGAIFGSLGEAFNISTNVQGILQIFIGIFMLATAGRILNLHPIFRHTIIQPPKFIIRRLKSTALDGNNHIKSALLGLLTIFIPCGVTQAMLILSIGSGSALNGALIMFFFTLGTSPVFFILGMTVERIFKSAILSKIAALTIVIIGIMSINNGQILRGSIHTFQNYYRVFTGSEPVVMQVSNLKDGYQLVEIIAKNNGYTASTNTLKRGVPVKLTINSKNVQSCARSFVIPALKISRVLPVNGIETIEFMPGEDNLLTFSCGMGMYTGSFNIIE